MFQPASSPWNGNLAAGVNDTLLVVLAAVTSLAETAALLYPWWGWMT